MPEEDSCSAEANISLDEADICSAKSNICSVVTNICSAEADICTFRFGNFRMSFSDEHMRLFADKISKSISQVFLLVNRFIRGEVTLFFSWREGFGCEGEVSGCSISIPYL